MVAVAARVAAEVARGVNTPSGVLSVTTFLACGFAGFRISAAPMERHWTLSLIAVESPAVLDHLTVERAERFGNRLLQTFGMFTFPVHEATCYGS